MAKKKKKKKKNTLSSCNWSGVKNVHVTQQLKVYLNGLFLNIRYTGKKVRTNTNIKKNFVTENEVLLFFLFFLISLKCCICFLGQHIFKPTSMRSIRISIVLDLR